MGLVPGNRVLLSAPNNPMLAAAWFGVIKAGGIAVATMPLLRAMELKPVIAKAQITHALCDLRLATELKLAVAEQPVLQHIRYFNDPGPDSLEAAMARQPATFTNVATAADDTCILAFTFGLGGLLLFPMAVGAATVLLEKASPENFLDAIREHGATVLFTAPTSYRVLAAQGAALRGSTLRQCVSAGEALPAATRASSSSVAQFSCAGNCSSGSVNRNSGCSSGGGRLSRAKVSRWALAMGCSVGWCWMAARPLRPARWPATRAAARGR